MSIRDNLCKLRMEIPPTVKLIAVSKTKSIPDIREAYEAGQTCFGENKAQEIASKHSLLPENIEWHFIGHLQGNKVRQIAPFINYIHSIDSLKLLSEVNKEAQKCNRSISCLLQIYIATEETKFGLDEEEAQRLLENPVIKTFDHIKVSGVMGMATYTCDEALIGKEFRNLSSIFERLKKSYFSSSDDFKEISMGMSNDFRIAIKEGSTMLRIGTTIFGERSNMYK